MRVLRPSGWRCAPGEHAAGPLTRLRPRTPCRNIRDLHMATIEALQVEASCRKEIERLLSELQQLLIGISIMQVIHPSCHGAGGLPGSDRHRGGRRALLGTGPSTPLHRSAAAPPAAHASPEAT